MRRGTGVVLCALGALSLIVGVILTIFVLMAPDRALEIMRRAHPKARVLDLWFNVVFYHLVGIGMICAGMRIRVRRLSPP